MTTRRISARRLEEGVQEEALQGGVAPKGVNVPLDAQVPPKVIKSLLEVKVMRFRWFSRT